MSALAERYAEAAWRQAKTVAVGDALVTEIVAFLDQLEGAPLLHRTLSDPALAADAPKVLRAIATKLKLSELCQRILLLTLERGRLSLLTDIGRAIARRTDKAAGRLRAHVQLAVAPTEAQVQRIEQVLAKRFGKPVIADVQIHTDLLGGMLCRIGRLTFDASLKKQFAQFAERAGASHA